MKASNPVIAEFTVFGYPEAKGTEVKTLLNTQITLFLVAESSVHTCS